MKVYIDADDQNQDVHCTAQQTPRRASLQHELDLHYSTSLTIYMLMLVIKCQDVCTMSCDHYIDADDQMSGCVHG